jgi:hypothetical protein
MRASRRRPKWFRIEGINQHLGSPPAAKLVTHD